MKTLRINSRDRLEGGTPDSCMFNLSQPIEGRWRLHTAVVPNSAAPVGGYGAEVTPRLVVTVNGTRHVLMVNNASVAPIRHEYHSIATLITDVNTKLATLPVANISITRDTESNHLRLNKPAGATVTWHAIFDEPGSTLSPVLGITSNIEMAGPDTFHDTHMPVSLATDMLCYTIRIVESKSTMLDTTGRTGNFVIPLSGNSGTTEIYRASDHGEQQALEFPHPVKTLRVTLSDDRGFNLGQRGFGQDWMILLEKVC